MTTLASFENGSGPKWGSHSGWGMGQIVELGGGGLTPNVVCTVANFGAL